MSSYKIPVLVTRYADDLFTARVLDGPETDAVGISSATAFEQVKTHLKKQAEKEPDQHWPSIEKYDLRRTSVEVRLYYHDGKRRFPATREMKIPVRYVLGHYVDKSVECFLPDFDIVFHCPAMRELPNMIREAVRGAASRLQSRALTAATPPAEAELRFVRVRPSDRTHRDDSEQYSTLSLVADPVVQRKRKTKRRLTLHRDEQIARITKLMSDSSCLLVGGAGCGKTSIARAAARIREDASRALAKASGAPAPAPLVWATSAENLIAGMQYLGEWEARLEAVIAELDAIGGYLLVASLVDLIRLGGTQPTDSLAAFLIPYIRRGEVRLIVETTHEELEAARRLIPGLVECFQIVSIEPLTSQQTTEIVGKILSDAGRNNGLEVESTAAETATRLFSQFMPYQSPPRDVVQLTEAVIDEKRQQESSGSITSHDMVTHFTKRTGLPSEILLDTMTLSSGDVQEVLSRQVIGQSQAVQAAVDVVLRLKAGLCDPKRPVSTMLFCGPTGVGKTQLARSLADYLFGKSELRDKSIIRLDMSEYANWDAVDRLMIAPNGEVASWISRLRARPMSVILLDEFEKSSPEVHDTLLSALDEGRITDRFGRTTTLCGSIVILTSNVGSKSSSQVGFVDDNGRSIDRAIQQEFRPEFLNRLDEIVRFEPLPMEVVKKIVEKELQELSNRETLRLRRAKLVWNDDLVTHLASIGFDPLLGARPLQRAIEREIVSKIARQLLSDPDSSDAVEIDLNEMLCSADVES